MDEHHGSTGSSRSPWVWVGCGCGALVLAVVLAVAGMAFFGVMAVRGMKDDLENPEARRTKALEILGSDELPAGYHPVLALEVPFLMDMALLGDAPAPEGMPDDEDLELDRLLAFVRMRDFGGDQRREIRRFFEGESTDLDLDLDVDLDLGEAIGRGSVDLQDAGRARWGARECGYRGSEGQRREGVCTLVLGECPDQSWVDFALWIRPLDDVGEASRIQGDLEELLAPIDVCPAR